MKKSVTRESRGGGSTFVALTVAIVLCGQPSKSIASEHKSWPVATYYTVVAHPGDTVSAIGERYRVSPSVVAKLNGVADGAHIVAGRVVLIPARSPGTRVAVLAEALDPSAPNYATAPRDPVARHTRTSQQRSAMEVPSAAPHPLPGRAPQQPHEPARRFSRPIAGPVISSFGAGAHGTRNDGINIAAEFGAPFRAAAGGTVSYAGSLRGYGNLILITHAGGYITAYAHAENIAVTRGQEVGKGQVIGTAGQTGDVDQPQLHFEIRRGTKAIDPSFLLAANS
ncbi:MAG TPA: peptidoglycan DD-metalloendopeptidase family protein [Rhizomicrobium sp.]|jgi:murein DD-endopeptidase MepM/ murein hydrolase activator NlpD|nr:peptidoglycan DD-metalloendopeptidase family protein [Rhizomicrobium sp.]